MIPSVTFATSCWEKDWRLLLLDPDYLQVRQIGNHLFPFAERLLVINNVSDLNSVQKCAEGAIERGILSRVVVAKELPSRFELSRSDFNEWQYYNALGPLTAIDACQSDYLLYLTGDVYLKKGVNWLPRALRYFETHPECKVANLTWNGQRREAAQEAYRKTWNFYVARRGFSDQMFLVRRRDFQAPIYGWVDPESRHYPRGAVFEARVFSHMKRHGWERITWRRGSYTHENVV